MNDDFVLKEDQQNIQAEYQAPDLSQVSPEVSEYITRLEQGISHLSHSRRLFKNLLDVREDGVAGDLATAISDINVIAFSTESGREAAYYIGRLARIVQRIAVLGVKKS